MPEGMFDEHGRLRIPERLRERKAAPGEKVVINAAYCPNGHNLVSLDTEVSGFPSILLGFSGSTGIGRIAISAVLGDPARCLVDGVLPEDGAVVTLHCTVCGDPLDVLGECACTPGALAVLAYLYPRRDPYQAIAFCSSLSCDNSAVIRAGEAIRTQTGQTWQG